MATKKKTPESEKTLEARLVREIEARGGMALKYTSQFHRGIPDRICLLPYGNIYFVELKSTGKKPTKLQEHAMQKLRDLSHIVVVISSTQELEDLLEQIDYDLNPPFYSA
jgi:Holliday junction resolvase